VSTQRDEVKGTMRISYNKLFKLLIDKGMKKKELREKAGISASTVVKMGHNEPVSIELIGRICLALDCNAGDVVEFFPDEPEIES
jgi:putative transcriptional regulator